MTRSLDIVQAQLAVAKDILREIERITGTVKFSVEVCGRLTAAERTRDYVMDRIAWLRHEERTMQGRLHEKV